MTGPSYLPVVLESLRGARSALFALSTGVSLCAGISLFLIWRRTVREQLWLLFLSLAYLSWVAQYLLAWHATGALGAIAFSVLNNYCLMLSALLLFRSFTRVRILALSLLCLLTVLLAQLAAGTALARVPDSLASVATLGLFGVSLSQAIPLDANRKRLRALALAAASSYMALQVFYSLSPLAADALLGNPSQLGSSQTFSRPLDRDGILEGLDLLAFTFAQPLRLIFYLIGLYMVSRSIERLHPRESQATGSQEGFRPSIATISEIAENFRKVLDADVCEICLRLPGQRNPQVLWRAAARGGRLRPVRDPLPTADKSYVGRVLATGRAEWAPHVVPDDQRYLDRHPHLRRRESVLTVPIGLRTAVGDIDRISGVSSASRKPTIGALNVEWFERIALTETTALQVQQMADQLAPFLEKERELAAIDSLSQRAVLNRGATAEATAHEILTKIAAEVHDLLAPNQTELQLRWGFEEPAPVVVGRSDNVGASSGPPRHLPTVQDQPQSTCALTARLQVGPEYAEASVSGWAHDLGAFRIVVPRPFAPILDTQRPILGTTKFYRDLIASMIADAAVESYRRTLADQLARVALAVTAPTVQTPDQWWHALNGAVTDVGLCWAAAQKDPDSPWLCPLDFALKLQAIRVFAVWEDFQIYAPNEPLAMNGGAAAGSIARLRFPGVPEGWLWLGIPRRGFGPELAAPRSPWRAFLEGLATMSGGALARMRAREQIDILTREAMVAQSVVVGSTLLHDVMNHATSVVNNLHVLQRGLDSGQLATQGAHRELLASILSEAAALGEVMTSLRQVRSYDQERPTSLAKALMIVERLHHFRLEKQRFNFEINVPGNLPQIDAPLHVLTLVFSNLVTNSLDAKASSGRIWIRAKHISGRVICEVQDDGPGLPAEREVFAAGRSTKPGGTGLGLWLSKRCLEDIGGQILAETLGRPGARFVLDLPTPPKEYPR